MSPSRHAHPGQPSARFDPAEVGWVTSTFAMTLAELNTFVSQQDHAGRLPIDFDMYRDATGKARYSAVFLDNPEGLDWHLRGDLSYAGFQTLDTTYGGSGFRTISIDSATNGSDQLFGAIWWENVNGRTWASRVHGGETDYANWWGYLADQGLRQIFNGRFLGADGKVKLLSTWRQNNDRYDSARTWQASLPSFYQPVRLVDLASNRGCVRWYAGKETYKDPAVAAAHAAADDEMGTHAYDSSAQALPLYADDPLVCTPGTYHYSTQGYGVLGAALEGATGKTSADLVQ